MRKTHSWLSPTQFRGSFWVLVAAGVAAAWILYAHGLHHRDITADHRAERVSRLPDRSSRPGDGRFQEFGPGVAAISEPATRARAGEAFATLPLYFVENQGHVDARVAYYVHGRDTTFYFTSEGVTIALTGAAAVPQRGTSMSRSEWAFAPITDREEARRRWAVKLDFVGANPKVRVDAHDQTSAVVSYFKGPREQWKTGLKTYGRLVYRDVWPGIDAIFTGTATRLKYAFLIHPGADPERIRLAYRGATSVTLTGAGELDVNTPVGGFRDEKPYAYQEVDGQRAEVAADYALDRRARNGVQGYHFNLGFYDRSLPLVLDPAIAYAGYIGGASEDAGFGIAVDGLGNAYITGATHIDSATTFPATVGPDLTHNGGQYDAFVAKVNAAGTGLVYAGYIGGNSDDFGFGIAVDAAGNAYVAGNTYSSQATFPATVGPDLTYNGDQDVFIAKVNAVGTGLVYAGYIGGSGRESGGAFVGIAVDATGNAYVTSSTSSSEATFPATVGPDLTYNGGFDAFVAKVNAAGTGLAYAGYIGGADSDAGNDVAVDALGNAYVTGRTASSETTFPATVGPDLTFNGAGGFGAGDAFVAKVNAAGTGLAYAGYIGGDLDDVGYGIAVDALGNAYVSGGTESSQTSFPATVGPDLTFNGGTGGSIPFFADAFVAKVNAAGTGLAYAGYIGGSGDEVGYGIAVDSLGNAYVTGGTESSEATFPVTAGPDLTFNGTSGDPDRLDDAFVAKVNAAGTGFAYAGYIGGSNDEEGFGIAVDGQGNAYVTGRTASSEATFPVTVGPDLTWNGGDDAFVAKITSDIAPPATLTLDPVADTNTVGDTHCVTATVKDASGNPVPNVTVRFTVTGSVTTSGSATTDANGEATFCYTGPPLPGADAITAFADSDNDGTQDTGEPSGAAAKTWVLPVTTPHCEISITNGGRITALNGHRATFGGNAQSSETGETQGQEQYRDHGPVQPLNVHSINVMAIVCDGPGLEASIYGQATINGAGSFFYRIKVRDLGEPGAGFDTYWILLETGYTSGEQTLEGGNVQIRRQ
jgi:hypothetical protein